MESANSHIFIPSKPELLFDLDQQQAEENFDLAFVGMLSLIQSDHQPLWLIQFVTFTILSIFRARRSTVLRKLSGSG
jgi:hypothetical protein